MNPLQEIDPTAVLPSVDDLIPSTLTDDATTEPAPALPHFFSQIISSIFDGGVNPSLIIGMHASFFGLEVVLLALWVITGFNAHVLALMGIGACLWGSTGWFVQELLAFQRQQKAEELENRESDAAAVATDSTGGDDSLASDREAKKDR